MRSPISILRGLILGALLLAQTHQGRASAQQLTEINYAFIYSGGAGGFNSSGAVPSIEIAEEMIRENGTILQRYNFTSRAPLDSRCERATSLNQFFRSVLFSDPPVLALLGSGCSVATEPVAEISHYWNISQISFASDSPVLSDRNRFQSYFRTYPSFTNFVPAIHAMIEKYGWNRIMFLNQDENLFTGIFAVFMERITKMNLNVTVASVELPSAVPVHLPSSDLFKLEEDFRVFFINSYSGFAREIICEAAKLNLTYPRYAWLTFGWYPFNWWSTKSSPNSVDCTDEQLAKLLDRAFALQIFPNPDDNSSPTDTGLSADEFYDMYVNRSGEIPSKDLPHVSPLAYDAVWALAIALNRTANMINLPEDQVENITECNGKTNNESKLVPLENFTYTNSFMGCVIRWNLARTDFIGASGRVRFNEDGSREQIQVIVWQYRRIEGLSRTVKRIKIGFIASSRDNRLNYVNNETNQTVYPDGIPPDGTPINITVTYHLALVITYDIIAFLGLIFTTVCLVFNFAYRKRKIVRLTSPNLNYFIILGSYFIFISIFFITIPTFDHAVVIARCNIQNWLGILGYTLGFATILSKMVRIYHIFHNPTVKKQSLKDWHLVIIILSMTSFSVLLLLIGIGVPKLRPFAVLRRNDENPTRRNELGVRIDYFVWHCSIGVRVYWLIVVYVYLGLFQLIALLLAILTRKVKIKALNDSKYVAAIIYVLSIVLILVIIGAIATGQHQNTGAVLINGAQILGATTFLGMIFIPKMVSLYSDPLGESVFESHPTSIAKVAKSGTIEISTAQTKIEQLESKVKELESELTKGDKGGKSRVKSSLEVQFEFHSTNSSLHVENGQPDGQFCSASGEQSSAGTLCTTAI